MDVLKFIFFNLDRYRKKFIFIYLTAILDGIATFLIPVTLAEFTKKQFTQSNFASLVGMVVLLYLSSLIFQWIIRKWGEGLGSQFSNYLRLKYFTSLEKLPIKNLIDHHSGYILSLINKVSDGMIQILFDIIWDFAKGFTNIALFFYFTAKESTFIAIVNLITLAIFISVSTLLSRKMIPIADDLNKKRASLLESYSDFMSNILTLKRIGVFPFAQAKLAGKTEENNNQIQKLQDFHSNRWFILHSLYGIAFLSTISFLLFQVSKGDISASVLILFIAAYTTIRGNVERLSENFKALMEMKVYINSLDKIISPGEKETQKKVIRPWKEIKFDNVFFQYPGTEKKINIPNFSIKKGQKICIFGKSGEGKTTFLNLLANFLEPNNGKCFVDGNSFEVISRKFFQNNMTMVSQETELFNIPLRENITLGQKINDDIILEVFAEIDLLSWVQNLENGLDTIVGEKGVKLSAGQKQRINLIRGILLNRNILLLDEPTSHLDTLTEKKVINFLAKSLKNKTAIIVSHQEAIKKICDQSYIIQDHQLVEIRN